MKRLYKLSIAILFVVTSSIFGLPSKYLIHGDSETFRPLLQEQIVSVSDYAYLYNDGSMISASYSLNSVNKFFRNSIVLDKKLDVIHKVPENVSFQYFSNKKIVNAWYTSNYYSSPAIYEIDGKLVTLPYTDDLYIDFGLAVVGVNGKNKVYNLETGNLIISFDKSYAYDSVKPISRDYLLVANQNKNNIYDYSGNKLFPDLDDIGKVWKMQKGLLITKDSLINTNTKMIYKFQDIIGTNTCIGVQINDNFIHYLAYNTDKNNDQTAKTRFNMWSIGFDGRIIDKRPIGTDSYVNLYLGSIDDYLVLEERPVKPGIEKNKVVCLSFSQNKKIWEWIPDGYGLDQYFFFDDAGFKMIAKQKNGFSLIELATGKILKEYLAPSVLETMNDCKNQYLDVPTSVNSKNKSLFKVNANLKLQNLGCVAPSDFMNVSGNNVVKVGVIRKSENDYEITWSKFDLRNSMLIASSKREFVNIFEPQKSHLLGTDKMVIVGRDHTMFILDFSNGQIVKVDYPGVDPKSDSINNKLECKVFANNAYLFFSYPIKDSKKTLITLDLKSAKVLRIDNIESACRTIFFASEGMLVSDYMINWFDKEMKKGTVCSKMVINGCFLYSYTYDQKLLITDLATGMQRNSKKTFFRSISSVDGDIVYSHSGIFTDEGDWLQDYIYLDKLSKDQSTGSVISNLNSGVIKYTQCPVFTMIRNKAGEIEIKSNDTGFKYEVYLCHENNETDIGYLSKIELTNNAPVPTDLIENKSMVKLFVFSNGLLDLKKSNPIIDKNSLRPRFEGYPVNYDAFNSIVVTHWGGK